MNSEITLEINGYRRDILRYNYRFSRNIDLKGRPTTGVLDGSIYIEMESDGDSSILDMMLVDMNKPRPSFFFRAEPASVSGRIRHTKDEMMLRELVFDEAYISCYGETMNATGNSPMITHFLISPTRLDINRTIRLDRRIKTTYGFWWEEYKEEEKKPIIPVAVSEPSKPIVLVTSVKGKTTALPNAIVEYKVTDYNIPNISSSDKTRIKWMIKVEGQEFSQKTQGETLKLTIDKVWAGKDIVVMPYLKKYTQKVSIKTKVELFKKTIFFARSKNWAGKTIDGKISEDMMYKDKKDKDVLAINRLFKIQLDASDESLFTDMITLFNTGTLLGGKENAKGLITHFRKNTGDTFSSSYMDEQLKKHETFKQFVFNQGKGNEGVLQLLCNQLKKYNGNINKVNLCIGEVKSTRVKFNQLNDKLHGMTLAVDDTSAYQVYVDDYELNSTNSFSCKLRIEIYDHFGLDMADVEKYGLGAGFRAWYVLQHTRGYRPFLTQMKSVIKVNNHSF